MITPLKAVSLLNKDLSSISSDELIALNKLLVTEFKRRRNAIQDAHKSAFSVGDSVKFRNKFGSVTFATVTKVLQKNIDVTVTGGNGYRLSASVRVSPSLLSKV